MEGRTRLLRSFAVLHQCAISLAGSTPLVGQSEQLSNSGRAGPVYLVIRTDDAGMTHSVNMTLEKLIATGLPAPSKKADSLVAYRQLITMQGLQSMRRPAG